MQLLSLIIIRKWYRRALVLPRNLIDHSEPSKFFSALVFILGSISFIYYLPSISYPAQTVYSPASQSNSLGNTNDAARSAAMGSAFTGVADDASALFLNPAGLAFLDQGQFYLNSDLWLVGTFQETALLGLPNNGIGGFGFAADYLDYGQFDGRDGLGAVTPGYSANRLGLQAGWGYEVFKNFSLGLALNGTQSTLVGTGYTSFSSNIGFLWRDSRGLGLGASYVNAGWVSPGGTSEDAVNIGASYQAQLDKSNRLLAAVGGSVEPQGVDYFQAGAEFSIQGQVFLRAGCQIPLSDEALGGLADLTAGVGFHLAGFSLDYAYLPYGDLGAAHRVSVGYFFGNGKAQAPKASKKNASSTLNAGGYLPDPLALSNQGLPPLPPPDLGLPVMNPAQATLPAPTPTPAAGTAQTKDSLEVVQVDLPDNPASTGAELEKQGKYREALQAYISAVQQDPSDAASWWAMGNLYRKFNQKTYAIQCFEQTLKLKPDNQQLADWLKQYKASNP